MTLSVIFMIAMMMLMMICGGIAEPLSRGSDVMERLGEGLVQGAMIGWVQGAMVGLGGVFFAGLVIQRRKQLPTLLRMWRQKRQ